MPAKKYECDCGARYSDLAGVEACQLSNHGATIVERKHHVPEPPRNVARGALPPQDAMQFLDRLRHVNRSRMVRFGHGDIHDEMAWGPMKWGCALAGEVGELCNVLKKYERQAYDDPKPDQLTAAIAEEIADVIIYADLIAEYFMFDLARVIAVKFNRVSSEHGMPERLAADDPTLHEERRLPVHERIELQTKEFEAVAELTKQFVRHEMTAVVDDDYPSVRHDYESALSKFLAAVAANRGLKFIKTVINRRYGEIMRELD